MKMKQTGWWRRLAMATMALVVLSTVTMVAPLTGTVPEAAAWPPTPNGVQPGSERIPVQVHHVTRTLQTGEDANGPFGYCYDESYITFDPAYGKGRFNDSLDPGRENYVYYRLTENSQGVQGSQLVYTSNSRGATFDVNYPQGSSLQNPWLTFDHYGLVVHRAAWGGQQTTTGSGYLVDRPDVAPLAQSYCAPSKREPRVASMQAIMEREEFWTAGPIVAPIDISISTPDGPFEVGDEIPVDVTVTNRTDHPATGITYTPTSGLSYPTDRFDVVGSAPTGTFPSSLQPGETVTRRWTLRPNTRATSELRSHVRGTVDGSEFTDEAIVPVSVPPEVEVVLSTDVTGETKVGDRFNVTATITNHDEVEMAQIDADSISTRPRGPVKQISGPLMANGRDPERDWPSLQPGQSMTLHWVMEAEEAGVIDLTAYIWGVEYLHWTRWTLSAETRVAIEAPGLLLEQVRLQPGTIVPGQFGNVRGTVTNTGTTDITGIDFTLESNPELKVVEGLLDALDPSVSPRIPTLEPEESREFMIPVAMVTDAGELGSYRLDLRLAGTTLIGGEPTEVEGVATAGNALDLTPYWSTILGDVRRNLLSDTIEIIEGINDWGDSSTLGGIAVGSTTGALNAFRNLGDGVLTVNDFIAEETGSGGVRLTETGKAIVEASREYLHTHTAQEMAIDLAELEEQVAVGGVGVFAEWLRDVDRAASAGDTRRVAELLAEPGTEVALGFGVEKAAGKLFTRAVESAAGRKVASYLKRAPQPEPVDELMMLDPEYTPEHLVARELQDLKDMPTGVAITGETAARAGLTADEHGWMIEMAKEHGIAFFVRPRPETAAKFAKLGYNAKPMAIKLKSISEIDHRWLGWEDYADAEGLVVFREPRDPLQAMMDAVEAGELEYGGPEIDKIIERYNLRRAEWKSYEKPFGEDGPTVDPRDGILHKLNGDTIGPDGSISPGEGFTVQRYGKTIRTKVTIDPDGVIRFSHNDKPVYSDIDLLSIAKPDGSAIDPEVHRLVAERAGFGIDSQHGASVNTSDFPDWDTAKRFAVQYANEHRRGGDPLVIVGSDATTLGYVDQLTVPEGPVPGANYDLYGVIQTTYEGAGRL